jgi:hypothetical protein
VVAVLFVVVGAVNERAEPMRIATGARVSAAVSQL